MNIIITGGLGHIGSKLIHNLTKIKNLKKVYIIDSAKSNNLNVLFNLKFKKIKIRFIQEDLLDDKILYKIKDKIDVVIHLASIVGTQSAELDPKASMEVNFMATRNIAELCKIYKIKQFIYSFLINNQIIIDYKI